MGLNQINMSGSKLLNYVLIVILSSLTLVVLSVFFYLVYLTVLSPASPLSNESVNTDATSLTDAEVAALRRELPINSFDTIDDASTTVPNNVSTGELIFTPITDTGTTSQNPVAVTSTSSTGSVSVGATGTAATGVPNVPPSSIPSAPPTTNTSKPVISSRDTSISFGEVAVVNEAQKTSPQNVQYSGVVRVIDYDKGYLMVGNPGADMYQINLSTSTEYFIGTNRINLSQIRRYDIVDLVGIGYENSVQVDASRVVVTGEYQAVDMMNTI